MTSRVVLLCAFALTISGGAAAAAEDTKSTESSRHRSKVGAVYGFITREYVDPVDEATLFTGCRERMLSEVTKGHPLPDPIRSQIPASDSLIRRIAELYLEMQRIYREAADDKTLAEACVRGMVGALEPPSANPRSTFLDSEELEELQVGSQGLAGLGLELQMDAGVLKIVSALDESPAARAGLRRDDAIDRIDGVATRGLTLRDAVKRLRGEPQSTVALTVTRPGAVKPLELTIARAIVRVDPVTWRLVAPGYAHVRISRFQDATVGRLAVELEAALRDSNGALRGVILDLRNNTGGLLNASVGVAAAFLPPDVLVVETKARSKTGAMRLLAQPSSYARRPKAPDALAALPPVFKTVPMAVLVNGESASGAEIVAAALQDHKRATIIGSRTLGAGTLRTIFPLPEKTALNLATARLVRPNGDAIEQKGVTPDIAIEGVRGPLPRIDAPDDPQVARAVQVLESRRR